eukprot:7165758-Prymnesium_polylepis.1
MRDGSDLNVAVEPGRDACVDGRACCAEHGRCLVSTWFADVELISAVCLPLQGETQLERADHPHPIRRLISQQSRLRESLRAGVRMWEGHVQ